MIEIAKRKPKIMMALAGAVIALSVFACGFAYADDSDGDADAAKENAQAQLATQKDETVYVKTDASGNQNDVKVEVLLRNDNRSETLIDASDLTGIEPGEDSGTFTQNGRELIWQADGENVEYSGKTDSPVPVQVSVSYFLDGQQVSAEGMLGASGHVKVRYDYANSAIADGRATPFLMVTGILLDDSKFSNVTVANGKLIADADRTIVVGYALPGMQASLDIDKEDLDLPSYFEFEADVKDFSLNASLTYASASMLDDFDKSDLDTSELSDSVHELSNAMGDIIDAASEFSDGLEDLNKGVESLSDALDAISTKIPEMVSAITSLQEGATDLKEGIDAATEGVGQLSEGATGIQGGIASAIYGDGVTNEGLSGAATGASDLADGAKELAGGLQALAGEEGLPALKAAADQLAAGLSKDSLDALCAALEGASAELGADSSIIEQIKGNSQAASSAIAQAQEALAAIDTSKIEDEELRAAIDAQIANAKSQVEAASGSITAIDAAAGNLSTAATMMALGAMQAAVDGLGQASGAALAISGGLETVIGNLDPLVSGSQSLADGASTLSSGLDAAVTGLQQLYKAAGTVASGIGQLNDEEAGLPAASEGAGKLGEGLGQLGEGASKLDDGVGKVADGAEELKEGASAAAEGSVELVDGLKKYNDEGISEIVGKVDGDLQGFVDRFTATADLGKEYDNFSGKAEGTPSSVKFVFEVAGITE